MESYIQQLLSDLRRLHDAQPPPVDYRLLHPQFADVPDELSDVVAWEMAPRQPVEELFGIPGEAFPPPEQLTESQMQALAGGILELWASWSITTDAPAGISPVVIYQVLREFWQKDKLSWVPYGHIGLDLCGYDIEQCCWGREHCTCRQGMTDEELGGMEML